VAGSKVVLLEEKEPKLVVNTMINAWGIPEPAVRQLHFTNKRMAEKGRSVAVRLNAWEGSGHGICDTDAGDPE